MKLENGIEKYLSNSIIFKSHDTYLFEKQYLTKLLKYFGNVELSEISEKMVNEMILKFKEQSLSNTTINKAVQILKRLYKFLDLDCSFYKVKKLREVFITFGMTSESTLNKVLEVLETYPVSVQALIHLFLDTGIRLREMCNLTWDCVNIQDRFIKLVVTKGKKSRYVYFSEVTQGLLTILKNNANLKLKYLFVSPVTNTKYTQSGIEQIFRRMRNKLNLEYDFSPHRLRHYLSSKLYSAGADLLLIQRILGHCSPEVTQRYIHTNLEQDLNSYDKFMDLVKKISTKKECTVIHS